MTSVMNVCSCNNSLLNMNGPESTGKNQPTHPKLPKGITMEDFKTTNFDPTFTWYSNNDPEKAKISINDIGVKECCMLHHNFVYNIYSLGQLG